MLDSLEINITFHFKKLQISDAEAFKRIRDSNIEYLHNDTSFTLDETRAYLINGPVEYYGLFNSQHRLIGYVRFQHIDDTECQIGMDLDSRYQSQGLGYYIYETVLDVLFKMKYTSIYLLVLESNTRAFNLYTQLGFTVVDYTPEAVERVDGTRVGHYLMMLSR